MLNDGGTGLVDECGASNSDRTFCTGGTVSRLRYIQKNIIAPSAPTNTRLTIPRPRNTFVVQVSTGKQIAVLEEETHRECRRRPTRARRNNQSAVPILAVPKMAAITCNVKNSNIKISSLVATHVNAVLVMN